MNTRCENRKFTGGNEEQCFNQQRGTFTFSRSFRTPTFSRDPGQTMDTCRGCGRTNERQGFGEFNES